jgi:hypothetical protein
MRTEVSVPGISKERGKLPALTALGARELAVPLAAGPLTCGDLIGPALSEPVNAAEVGVPVATEHPVNTETIKSVAIRPRRCGAIGRQRASPGIRPRRVARSPSTAWRRACRRAVRCGQPACTGQ